MIKSIQLIIFFQLILISTNLFAANNDKLDVTTIIVIFIIAQIISIIGIVSLGFKRKNKKKTEFEK